MFGNDLYISLTFGILLSLAFSEKTKIVPAGLIVPGYLALVVDQPVFILIILLLSFLTYLIVDFGVAKVLILYGRRKFAAMLIVGMILKLLLDYTYPILPFEIFEFRGIGIIVPGIMANSFGKQGVPITLLATTVVTLLTFLVLTLYRVFI